MFPPLQQIKAPPKALASASDSRALCDRLTESWIGAFHPGPLNHTATGLLRQMEVIHGVTGEQFDQQVTATSVFAVRVRKQRSAGGRIRRCYTHHSIGASCKAQSQGARPRPTMGDIL